MNRQKTKKKLIHKESTKSHKIFGYLFFYLFVYAAGI